MVEKLRAAGIAVDAKVYSGATHSLLEAVSIAPLAVQALAESSAWLAGQLARTGLPTTTPTTSPT
jgi:acetyl esterase